MRVELELARQRGELDTRQKAAFHEHHIFPSTGDSSASKYAATGAR